MRKWIAVLALGLAACGGVPQAQHDEVVKERDALKDKVAKLEGQVAKLKSASKRTRIPPRSKGPDAAKVEEWMKRAEITRESELEATIMTNMGDITCQLFADKSPLTVANFVALSEGTNPSNGEKLDTPLYNGVIFHRVIKGFMIQGGDPEGTGRGGPGYKFEDEVDNGLKFDKVGQLAMANAGPRTNGSQFFITDSKPGHLTGKHTIFGQCDLPTVQKISSTDVRGSKPVEDIVIKTVKIARK